MTFRFFLALLAMVLCGVAGYTAIALPVLGEPLLGYYRIPADRLGLLLTFTQIAGTAGTLAAGFLGHRFAARRLLFWSLLGTGAGMALGACGTRYVVMLAAVLWIGVFAQAYYIAVQTYLVTEFPARRRAMLSLFLAVSSVVAIVISILVEQLYQWQARAGVSFGLILQGPLAVLALLLCLAASLYRRGDTAGGSAATCPVPDVSPDPHPFRPAAAGLVGLMVLHGTADVVGQAWIPTVLRNMQCYPVQNFKPGYVLAAYFLAYALARGLLALLPERTGRNFLLVAPGILGGALFLAGLYSGSQALMAGGFVLGGLLWSLEYPVQLAVLADLAPGCYSTCLAVSLAINGLMVALVGWGMGGWADRLTPDRMWMILLVPASGFVLTGLGGGAWLLARRQN